MVIDFVNIQFIYVNYKTVSYIRIGAQLIENIEMKFHLYIFYI